MQNPKIATLIFSSGKVVLTGIRDKPSLEIGLNVITGKMKEAGIA